MDESVIQRENLLVIGTSNHVIQLHTLKSSTVFDSGFSASILYQDAPHCLGGGREKVSAIVKLLFVRRANQSRIGFVNQGGGIERMSRFLACHLLRREFSQFVIHERQKLIGGMRIAC